MDSVNKTEYKIRDLGTRSVTLFPTKAQIFRQIKDVALKPGANEITIVGLSPTVDEHSIKVEGTGAALITDIAVEALPNRESFEDVYPSSDSETEDEQSDDDEKKPDKESPAVKAVNVRIAKFRTDLKRASDDMQSADQSHQILQTWSEQMNNKDAEVVIADALGTYVKARKKIFDEQHEATQRRDEASKLLQKEEAELRRLTKLEEKANASERKQQRKTEKEKQKEREKKLKLKAERQQEKQRVKSERENFWPKFCYTVRISLEANAYTPMSSRRNSISSEVDLAKASGKPSESEGSDDLTCDLMLSYVTTSAYWVPSYDLQLSTTKATGTLCFDAQLRNSTSESWDNCRITLSTTQSTFTGLEDTIPTLQPWHIKLAANGGPHSDPGILSSSQERKEHEKYVSQQQLVSLPKQRDQMFGAPPSAAALQDYQSQLMLLEQQNKKRLMMARQEANPKQQQMQMQQMQVQQLAAPGGLQGRVDRSLAGSGSMAVSEDYSRPQHMQAAMPPPPAAPMAAARRVAPSMSFGRARGRVPASAASEGFMSVASNRDPEVDVEEFAGEDETIAPEIQQSLEYQESLVEETGFTTTYDLPGLKTLIPKSTVSKQRVARINFPSVAFSHIVVAKYRPVAYLKAKLRNTSKLTLLKGPAGLTLDGSFMGRTTLPRCSAGDTFGLSLGVDPAIKAIYSKPDVRRSTTGVFTKEKSSVYTRALTLQNTRASAGKPVSLLVLDQVPVSEDERLKVQILTPVGMAVGGGAVKTGGPGRDPKDDKDWGQAAATLKKGGEVTWVVSLNAGKAVRLGLEYVIGCPNGDFPVECHTGWE